MKTSALDAVPLRPIIRNGKQFHLGVDINICASSSFPLYLFTTVIILRVRVCVCNMSHQSNHSFKA